MTSRNLFQDIHNYDGKLEIYTPSKKWTISEKTIILKELFEIIPNDFKLAKQGVKLILLDMESDNSKNLDQTNNMDASDILTDITLKIKEGVDILYLLIEQLEDMILTGTCPQGRAIRFYQIFLTITV